MPEKAFEFIPHMVLRCDVSGNVISVNAKWVTYTGLTLEQTQAQGWLEVVHPSEIESAQAAWEKCVVLQEPFTVDLRIKKTGSNEYKWHRVYSTFGSIQDQTMCITTFTDINTEKLLTKAQYDSMRKEEALSRRVRHATDPILTVNGSDQTVITWNRAAEKNFGYAQSEIIGKPYTILMSDAAARRHEGPNGYLARHQRTAIGHSVAIGTSNQVYAKKKNGEMIPITLIVDSYTKGNQHFYIVVLRIVTPELNVQKELHSSKDAFLSTMSHELRTPLFGLLGTLSLLPPMQDGVLQEEIHNMEVCVLNLLSIVNNMIDFYLLEHLRTTPNNAPFQLGLLLTETCSKLEGYVNPGVKLEYSVDGDVPFLVSDRKFLDHIISNLLSNALRFTNQGHVKVVAGLADDVVTKKSGVEIQAGQTMLQISVSDSGIGIDPAFYPEMFKPFCQVDGSNSRQYGGVGLGLAVSKCLVDLLGGIITYKSTVGQGTEFTVLIPVDFIEGLSSPPSTRPRRNSEALPNETIPPSPTRTTPKTSEPLEIPPNTQNSQIPHLPQNSQLSHVPHLAPSKHSLSPIFQHPPTSASSGCPFLRHSLLQEDQHANKPHNHDRRASSFDLDLTNHSSEFLNLESSEPESSEPNQENSELSSSPVDPCQISKKPPRVPPPSLPFVNHTTLLPSTSPPPHSPLAHTLAPPPLTQRFSRTPSPTLTPLSIPSSHPPISPSDLRKSCPVFHHPQMSREFAKGSPPASPKSLLQEAAEKGLSPTKSPAPPFPTISPRSSYASLPAFPTLPVPATPKRFAVAPPNVQLMEEMRMLNLHVLIVEDNQMNQTVIRKMLGRIGCTSVVAKHGKHALEILFDETSKDFVGYQKFHLVLMDCQMPVMDGFQATQAIRSWENDNVTTKEDTLKVLALTASSSLDNEKECYRSGMDGFIAKPVTVQGLYQYIV